VPTRAVATAVGWHPPDTQHVPGVLREPSQARVAHLSMSWKENFQRWYDVPTWVPSESLTSASSYLAQVPRVERRVGH